MAGDVGFEFENGNVPKPEVVNTAGNSDSEKKASHLLTFSKAFNRARKSLQKGLGMRQKPLDMFSEETRRKMVEAAPEGYRWLTNQPKDLTGLEEDTKEQAQYIEDLRRKNDVYFGEAFDIKGDPSPNYQAVYIRPKTNPQK